MREGKTFKMVAYFRPSIEMLNSFKLYTLLPAGRSCQQSGTATNKLNINLNGLQVTNGAICSANITTNDDTKHNSNNFKIFLAWDLN